MEILLVEDSLLFARIAIGALKQGRIQHRLTWLSDGIEALGFLRREGKYASAPRPDLLLLDEVLAGLNPSEIRDIVPVIRDIRAGGVTILMIEHVMQAVMALCDDVFVMAQGRMIAAGKPEMVCRDPHVIEAYLGQGAAARMQGAGHA